MILEVANPCPRGKPGIIFFSIENSISFVSLDNCTNTNVKFFIEKFFNPNIWGKCVLRFFLQGSGIIALVWVTESKGGVMPG